MRKTPSGIDVIRNVNNGTLRKCIGSAIIIRARARTKKAELANRMVIVDTEMSAPANQLIAQ
jgi:hypothetical protein